jgi:hypothetical protein
MQDFNDFKHRFIALKKELGLGNSEIGRICEVSPTAIRDLVEGNSRDFGVSKLLKLLDFKRELSAEWLLRGIGSMTKEDLAKETSSDYWRDRYEKELEDNQALSNDNKKLNDRVAEQSLLIKSLRNDLSKFEGKEKRKGKS